VLKDVRLAIYGEDDRSLVGMCFVERTDPSPDEFPGATNAVPANQQKKRKNG
jgi:hypothetical protein